jgi:hypothetical protein
MTPFIQMGLVMLGIFAIAVTAGAIDHHQDSASIKHQTAMGIQSMVALATLSMTGSLAEEAAEAHAVATPKELLTDKPPP